MIVRASCVLMHDGCVRDGARVIVRVCEAMCIRVLYAVHLGAKASKSLLSLPTEDTCTRASLWDRFILRLWVAFITKLVGSPH